MSDKTKKQTTAKAVWATFSPVENVSWCIQLSCDGESVSCCCVYGSQVFSNPVIHNHCKERPEKHILHAIIELQVLNKVLMIDMLRLQVV